MAGPLTRFSASVRSESCAAICHELVMKWNSPSAGSAAIRKVRLMDGVGPRPSFAATFRSSNTGGQPHGWPFFSSGDRNSKPSHWWVIPLLPQRIM